MITCNRCGKENQDHYKFCLGCGNELARPAPAPSPSAAGNGNDGPLETARTVLPPAPIGGLPHPVRHNATRTNERPEAICAFSRTILRMRIA